MSPQDIALAVAWILLAGWYAVEWRNYVDRGQRIPLVRNPLRLFAVAARRLARNRGLLLLLLAFYVASRMFDGLVMHPIASKVLVPPARHATATRGPHAHAMAEGGTRVITIPATAEPTPPVAGEAFLWRARLWLTASFPRVPSLVGGLVFQIRLVLGLVAMGGVLLWAWSQRPRWLGRIQERMGWPLWLTFGGIIIGAANFATGFQAMSAPAGRTARAWDAMTVFWVVNLCSIIVIPFLVSVVLAFEWRLLLQVGSGRCWAPRRALAAAMRSWQPVAWLSLLVAGPAILFATVTFLMPLELVYVSAVSVVFGPLLYVALVFTPWIILAERKTFRQAVVANFRLIGRWWRDLAPFALRFALVALLFHTLLDGRLWGHLGPFGDQLLMLLRFALALVLITAIVVAYTELRRLEREGRAAARDEGSEPERGEIGLQSSP